MTICDALHCPEEVGPDGCFCDPERPLCASDLLLCPSCRAAIEWDMPRAAS